MSGMSVVAHNMLSMNANRQLGISCGNLAKSSEKLSSGYKINRAADDAAGLSISEKMRKQIRGLTQASDNSQDGVSFCQIADGALDEVQGMLKRCTELSIQAANGTNADVDRQAIQEEIAQISREIDRVQESTLFNELRVFPDGGFNPSVLRSDGNAAYSATLNVGDRVFTFDFIDSNGKKVSSVPNENVKAVGAANPDEIKNSEMAQFVVQAAASAVDKLSKAYPTLFYSASTSNVQIGLEFSPQATGGRLASATIQLAADSTSSVASYRMWVDTVDYPVDQFSGMTPAQKADLAATIAHEMTHLVMDDTLTSGMLGVFPTWFKEGMAQTSSGDNDWMSSLSPSSTDADIKSYIKQLTTMPYGAGYAACMYLGWYANGRHAVNNTNIANGLDTLLSTIATKIKQEGSGSASILDHAINEVTGGKYKSTLDFENKFAFGNDADVLSFMHSLLNARGTNGAGSILGDTNGGLGKSESEMFSTLAGSYTSYRINPDNVWYANAFGTGFTFPSNLPSNGGQVTGVAAQQGFLIQAGAENSTDERIPVRQFNISMDSLFDRMDLDVSTIAGSEVAIRLVTVADAKVSAVRSYYGALQNRFEHAVANLDNTVENTTSAESRIRDTDMADEMVRYSMQNILQQAGQSMLAQANHSVEGVLALLQ